MVRWAFLDLPTPHAFAHRGGATRALENALSQFADVERLGYSYVETDVRTTSDGVAVLFHDEDAGRVTGRSGPLSALRWEQVRALSYGNGEQVPRLDDVLGAFPGLRFNLDLKDEGGVRSVPEVIARTGTGRRVCVTSFSQRRVQQARTALGPEVCTGLGVGGVARLAATGMTGSRRGRRAGGAGVLQVPWVLPRGRRLPGALVRLAQREGLAVHVWTVDDPAEMAAALDLGVDGIMTDRPVVLRQILQQRGQWTG